MSPEPEETREEPAATPARRSTLVWLGVAAFVVGLVISISRSYSYKDETWFLQILDRMASGDALYRDVWFSPTPFAPYLGRGLVEVLGTRIAVVKGMNALEFGLVATMAFAAVSWFGGRRERWLLLGAIVALAAPVPDGPYTALAYAAMLGSALAVLAWLRDPARGVRLLVVAGALAGVGLGFKQNVGILAAGAAGLAALLAPAANGVRERFSRGMWVAGGFLAVTLGVLGLLLASGSWSAFVHHGIATQGEYLRDASVSYLSEIGRWVETFSADWPAGGPSALRDTSMVLPLIALPLIALVAVTARGRDRPRMWTLFGFGAAAVAGVHPRWDAVHLRHAAPILLLGLTIGALTVRRRFGLRTRRVSSILAVAVVVLAVASLVGRSGLRLVSDPRSALPQFWPALANSNEEQMIRWAGQLETATADLRPTLILVPSASFYYLVTDMQNVTPFDYPLSVIISDASKRLIEDLRSGRIRSVCFRGSDWAAVFETLEPRLVTEFVEREMRPVAVTEACTIYTLPSS